jgi:hypothetical protein
MFKKKIGFVGGWLLLGFVMSSGAGCRSLPPLPPADLSEPGWVLWQGQAIWRPGEDAPEIAGDLLVTLRADGASLVQFAKPPFPLAIARTTPGAWQFESPSQSVRHTYPGDPPARVIWFQLARAWRTGSVPDPWEWQRHPEPTAAVDSHPEPERFRLRNLSTGETLEGYLVSQPSRR